MRLRHPHEPGLCGVGAMQLMCLHVQTGAGIVAGHRCRIARPGSIMPKGVMRYLELDVFTGPHGGGNRLGVVIGADAWGADAMQQFARTNDSVENSFVLAPTDARASYRVRIFTPGKEVRFAGHPSIGAAHAVLAHAIAQPINGALWQECAAGVLPIRVEGEGDARRLLLRMPPARVARTGADAHPWLPEALSGIARGKLPPVLIEGGRRWWLAEAAGETALRVWQPPHQAIAKLAAATNTMGLCLFARSERADYQLVVRAFAPGVGIAEDPASGAANGLIATYIEQAEPNGPLARGYAISQGREIGHDARLVAQIGADGVWVGGHTRINRDVELDWPAAPVRATATGC